MFHYKRHNLYALDAVALCGFSSQPSDRKYPHTTPVLGNFCPMIYLFIKVMSKIFWMLLIYMVSSFTTFGKQFSKLCTDKYCFKFVNLFLLIHKFGLNFLNSFIIIFHQYLKLYLLFFLFIDIFTNFSSCSVDTFYQSVFNVIYFLIKIFHVLTVRIDDTPDSIFRHNKFIEFFL